MVLLLLPHQDPLHSCIWLGNRNQADRSASNLAEHLTSYTVHQKRLTGLSYIICLPMIYSDGAIIATFDASTHFLLHVRACSASCQVRKPSTIAMISLLKSSMVASGAGSISILFLLEPSIALAYTDMIGVLKVVIPPVIKFIHGDMVSEPP